MASTKTNRNTAPAEESPPGLFAETPHPSERHPVNFARSIGLSILLWRLSLPPSERGQVSVCQRLSAYLGKPVDRSRLARVEAGNLEVAYGVVFAALCEMGCIEAVHDVIYNGDRASLQYRQLTGDAAIFAAAEAARPAARDRLAARTAEERST